MSNIISMMIWFYFQSYINYSITVQFVNSDSQSSQCSQLEIGVLLELITSSLTTLLQKLENLIWKPSWLGAFSPFISFSALNTMFIKWPLQPATAFRIYRGELDCIHVWFPLFWLMIQVLIELHISFLNLLLLCESNTIRSERYRMALQIPRKILSFKAA